MSLVHGSWGSISWCSVKVRVKLGWVWVCDCMDHVTDCGVWLVNTIASNVPGGKRILIINIKPPTKCFK